MARTRTLGSTALIYDPSSLVVGLDGKPLVTEATTRDGIRRVTRDLENLVRPYLRDGWKTTGEVAWVNTPDGMVVGTLQIRRD